MRKTTGNTHSMAVEMELGSHRLRLRIRTFAFLYKRSHVCEEQAGRKTDPGDTWKRKMSKLYVAACTCSVMSDALRPRGL